MTPEDLRHFVTRTLGCQCPPEVLAEVSSETGLSGGPLYEALAGIDGSLPPLVDRIITVGGRLVVVISRVTDRERVSDLLGAIAALRDDLDYNRARVVLAAKERSGLPVEGLAEKNDQRLHLHAIWIDDHYPSA